MHSLILSFGIPSFQFKYVAKILALVMAVSVSLALGSCGSSKTVSKTASPTHRPTKPANVKDLDISSMSKSERTLVKEATAWLGTPYKYGGNTRSGVDCSGFVYHVFRNSLDITLPRNSGKQHDYCRKISKKDLSTGDLVFFATTRGSKKVSHVGLYVGDGKMIHASTSRGVVCQNLSDDYYTRTFVGAGRIESFASINKSEKKKPQRHKPEKTSEKPTEKPKSEAAVPVSSAPVQSVHVDDIDSVLGQPDAPVVEDTPQSAVPEMLNPEPSAPMPTDTPEALPSPAEPPSPVAAPAPVAVPEPVPVTPVKIENDSSPATSSVISSTDGDARNAVLSKLPALK